MGTRLNRSLPLLAALAVSALVVGTYAALGGASYEPTPVAKPCAAHAWRPGGLQTVLEQVVLSALDGAACTLGVSREDLVLALRNEKALDAFAAKQHLTRADAERAVRRGLDRAVTDAESAGVLPGFVAALARRAVRTIQPWRILDVLESLRSLLGG